jgi:hypothetical protein
MTTPPHLLTQEPSVAGLGDLEQLRALKARYCRYADTKRWDDLAALFTADGVMRFHDPGGALINTVAAPAIAATIGGRVGAGQPVHHVFSHELEITSPGTARGIWAMEDLIFHDPESDPEAPFRTLHGFGHYHETYRKTAEEWRIATLDLTRLRVDITAV